MSDRSAPQQTVRRMIPRHEFGPTAIAVGHFLAFADVLGTTIDFVEVMNRRWPDLSFRDFWGAFVLAESLAWMPKGSA
jgi:hypothetical protein